MAFSHLDQLLAQTRSHREWLEYFGTLTSREFTQLYDQALERFPGPIRSPETFERHLPMMIGLLRKMLIAAHFMRPATRDERLGWIHRAETSFDWISKLPESDETRIQLSTLWESTQKYCTKFGYSSGSAFATRAPQKQFKDR
jgi:hypothetical protein